MQLGRILLQQGEVERAGQYLDQSYALAQALDLPPLVASALAGQGDIALAQGDYARAHARHCQSLQIAHQLRDTLAIAASLASLARVASAQADAEGATVLLAAAAGLRARMAAPLPGGDRPHSRQITDAARAQLGETAYIQRGAEGYALSADQAVAYALARTK